MIWKGLQYMQKNTLYLECYSGISGDMTVAALLDLGANEQVLLDGLKSLHVDGYKIEISRKTINSLDTCDFHVILDSSSDHDHTHPIDHDHSHPTDHSHSTEHNHSTEQVMEQEHSHTRTHKHVHTSTHQQQRITHSAIHYGHHDHRNLYDIITIIESSNITNQAKELAKKIFQIVAVAEAKAHGKSIEEVHFHEVGAVDSIIDIVATAICLDNLKIDEVITTELHEGTGHVTCQHGVLPIPVPAVLNIALAHNLPLHITSVNGEMVTPTGAAIVAAIRTKDQLPQQFHIQKIGLGAGKKIFEKANFLRAMLIEDTSINTKQSNLILDPLDGIEFNNNEDIDSRQNNTVSYDGDSVWILESNLDDCNGESLGLMMDILLQHGARDVYYTPIFMKKGRPAYKLSVICTLEDVEKLEELIFTHTTTIGVRKYQAARTTLKREVMNVQTPYGDALVKVCFLQDHKYYYPEYESVKELCQRSKRDYNTIYHLIQTLAIHTL